MSANKDSYKVINWKDYNKSLCERGSLTLWLDENLCRRWSSLSEQKKVVGEQYYPDYLIELCLTLGKLYNLKLRQSTGFISSILQLMGFDSMSVPNYSTLSRRGSSLSINLRGHSSGKHVDLAVDSTGLKVFGEGEWKVRKHGAGKRRTWRKLHLGVDVATGQILSAELTENCVDDAQMTEDLLEDLETELRNFYGDGAYDAMKSRKAVKSKGGHNIVPPPRNAVKSKKKTPSKETQERDEAVESIEKIGRKEWKEEVGYHKRSLSEVAMHRYKMINGDMLNARTFDNQKTEAMIGIKILNVLNRRGTSNSVKI